MLHDVFERKKQMEECLISKKKLLEKYNISYGALYRWKRKGLIPDEWFIKKATVTGPETFFPEKLVCERIEKIQSMKDEVLLDDLAEKLSGEENKNEFLLVGTAFGEKKFKMSDINKISVIDKSGEERDVLSDIRALFEKKEAPESKFRLFKKKQQ